MVKTDNPRDRGVVVSKATIDDINDIIASGDTEYVHFGRKLTIAVLTLPGGFKVSGESACADPEEFDKKLGEEYALDAVRSKLFEFENYARSR